MSHDLSNTDGVYSFADSRTRNGQVDAWHGLGTPVGHAMTGIEALQAAHLANWNVRKVPLWADIRGDQFYSGEGSKAIAVPNQYATVFNNPITQKITPIGVVGERYDCIQNESLVEFADALVDEGGAHYETAGSLQEYSKTFITMKLPRTMVLTGLDGAEDVTEWYLALFTSHDGSSAMFGLTTSVRVVCANTANAAIRGAKSRFSVRHTNGWKGAVAQAREALGLAFEYEEAFETEARALFETPFSVDDAKLFTEDLVKLSGAEEGTSTATARQNKANAILKLFVESPSIKGTPIAGTAYGAFNAVTEYIDHYATVTGGGEDAAVATKLRATRTLVQASSNTGLKADAWRILTNN